MDKSVS